MRCRGDVIELDHLLDAAEGVVLRQGINSLTLDAVAAEAGVSKGGLLYHYASKEKLIAAMVERIVRKWQDDFQAAIEAVEPGPGRIPRACLRMCFEESCGWDDCIRRASVVLLTALWANPTLVQPLRDAHLRIAEMVRGDGLLPGYAESVLTAVDGLWFSRIFGLKVHAPADLAAMRACLEEVIERGIAAEPVVGKEGP
jgi:AcrR family transcriptional regulator